jgi:hypothetical protein
MELAKEWSTAESARIWSSTQFGRQAENKPPPGRLLIQNFIARSFALHPSRSWAEPFALSSSPSVCSRSFFYSRCGRGISRYDFLAFHRPLYLNSDAALS